MAFFILWKEKECKLYLETGEVLTRLITESNQLLFCLVTTDFVLFIIYLSKGPNIVVEGAFRIVKV